MAWHGYVVAQRLEEPPQEISPAPAGQEGRPRSPGNRRLGRFRPFLASAGQRVPKALREGHAEKGGSDGRAAFDVLFQ